MNSGTPLKPYSVTPILLLAALALSACSPSRETSGPASIEVSDAWVRAPGAMAGMNMGSPGALYMLIGNHGDSTETLLKVESGITGSCQVHLTRVDSNGVASMHAVDGLEIEARSTVELKPGGYHVMLVDLRRDLKEGEKLTFVLTFRNAGSITIQALVKAP